MSEGRYPESGEGSDDDIAEEGEEEEEEEEKEEEEEEEEEVEEKTTAMMPRETEVNIESSVKTDIRSTEVLPLTVSAVDPSLNDVTSELQNVLHTSPTATFVQHNVIHMEAQQNVTVKGSANMSLGGKQHISTSPSAVDDLLRRTVAKLDGWTKGIVETKAMNKVLDKIVQGVSWITIKGCPGEGKTTTAHMVLNKLHQAGRKIFDVTTLEDFATVINSCQDNPVIMLDDVFGNLEFDKTEWSRWKPSLLKMFEDSQCLGTRDLSQEEDSSFKQNSTVLLVGREYVLNVCISDLGKVADFFTHDKHVVNMSTAGQRQFEEKIKIWKAISAASGIELDEDTIQKICGIHLPHGFPHVCKLFVTLRKTDDELSAEKFFEKPLQFLNETIQKFIRNRDKRNLFKAMLNSGGKITLQKLETLEDLDLIHVAVDLVGTYLRKEDACFKFDHPSVYDSVAYNMCTVATTFVIRNCELNFIQERIRLQKNKELVTGSHLVYVISRKCIPELATRFAAEISNGNLSQSLCHQAFTDAEFVAKTMSQVTVPIPVLVRQGDKKTNVRFVCLLSSNGSPELLKYVENHADVKLSEEDYNAVCHGVCHFAASDVLCYLKLKNKLDINDSAHQHLLYHGLYEHIRHATRSGDTFAMVAANGRNKSFVSKIMSMKPDVHTRNASGQTLLHVFVQNGLTDAAGLAIMQGADVNSKDKQKLTPLVYACMSGHEKIAQLLIKNGADVNIKARDGSIPLLYACEQNRETFALDLIKSGAIITDQMFSKACKNGSITLVELLVQNGYKLSTYTDISTTPMAEAVESANIKMVKWLIQHGASVNNQGSRFRTPIAYACVNGLHDIAKLLVDNGADVNAKDDDGYAPIHLASSQECFDILLRAKPYLMATTCDGNTALHFAASKGLTENIRALIREFPHVNILNNYNETPLFGASNTGSSDCVKLLLDAGADVNVKSRNGNTPLLVTRNSAECVRLLLGAGANVHALNDKNQSVLHSILYGSRTDGPIVDILIKANANVNARDDDDNTPLHYAVELWTQSSQTIPLLLNAGANPQLTDIQGKTPLHLAVARCFIDVSKMLISHGASVNSRDAEGMTPFHHLNYWAQERQEILNLLVKYGADINMKSYHHI